MSLSSDLRMAIREIILEPVLSRRRRRHLRTALPYTLRTAALSAREIALRQQRTPFGVLMSRLAEDPYLRDQLREFAVLHLCYASTVPGRRVVLETQWAAISCLAAEALKQAQGDPEETRRILLRRMRADADLDALMLEWGARQVLTTLPPS